MIPKQLCAFGALRAQMYINVYDRRAEDAKGLQLHKMIPKQLCAFGALRAQMYMIGAPKAQRAYNSIKSTQSKLERTGM